MEAQEVTAQDVTATTELTKDLSLIVKGKRTKRQRPQSPIPFTIAAHSSSDEGAYATSNSGDFLTPEENVLHSPTTEEEEETAKCLILLSQGQDFGTGTPKFSSKRFLETHTSGNGKAGIYVYECKTCNRTFPSFQALGGHRASHKKPRAMAEERKKIFVLSDEEEEQEPQPKLKKRSSISSSLSLQLTNRAAIAATFNNKVHECVICGAEFTSGQALGGHMRRHRSSPLVGNSASSATNTILSLSPLSMAMENYIDDDQEPKKFKSVNLSLDLNLPATQEDENGHGDLKLSFPTQQQKQSPLVLPAAPALVDCQY